ncbi:sulfite exporter TauE/SafE family protein [Stigmatella sp. ncwal1]|uniref:Probable membrane transporter protein n=1 Tax=Stigmatella ashevillensis TaxID=2995309 RepID=A0ABT5DAY7_9BACT|nr:sulfite exporter TauE/SafE family protein [Stigmatella ashevillena]MDC0710845.1 sulfite exporter TauE/SafE family protein [Stigmatella ashevillena]
MTALLLGACLSLMAGLTLGLLGGGGSLLTVPILVYVLGMEPRNAIATSLFVVGVTSLTGMLLHARARRVQWREGLLFGAAGMAGAALGARLGSAVPSHLLLVAFAGLMLATAFAMLRPRLNPTEPPAPLPARRWAATLCHGLGVGLLTGLVGAGGGFLVVPALALLGGLSMPRAVATSLLVISLNSSAGLLSAFLAGASVDWRLAAGMSLATVGGSFLGTSLSQKLSPEGMRRSFAFFTVALGLFILVRELPTLPRLPLPADERTVPVIARDPSGIHGLTSPPRGD